MRYFWLFRDLVAPPAHDAWSGSRHRCICTDNYIELLTKSGPDRCNCTGPSRAEPSAGPACHVEMTPLFLMEGHSISSPLQSYSSSWDEAGLAEFCLDGKRYLYLMHTKQYRRVKVPFGLRRRPN